jgi:hypothetical protein
VRGGVPRPEAAGLAVVLALAGGLLTAQGVRLRADPAAAMPAEPVAAAPERAVPERAATEPGGGGASAPGHRPRTAKPPAGRSVPTRLDIAAIGVHTGLIRLGLNKDGTVEVPPLAGDSPAGWYQHSVTPGENGSAVLLGHVDSARDGPAVFYRLASLRTGDVITVRRADGSTVRFGVTGSRRYPKKSFPTDDVYGPAPYPVLRLITCGGSFDRGRGSYRDNLVVSARALA